MFNFSFDLNSLLSKEIKFSSNNLTSSDKTHFYNELSVLLESGITLKSSLELISSELKKEAFLNTLIQLEHSIMNGESLSQAMRETNKFSFYEIYSVEIGEEVGKLSMVLQELSLYFKSILNQKRQLLSVLTYPIIILLTTFMAVFFMLHFVVPMFVPMLKRFGTDLPFITKVVIKLSEHINLGFVILLIIAVLFTMFHSKFKDHEMYRRYTSSIFLKLPYFGNLLRKIYIVRLSNALILLISSKVPLNRSIELVIKMIDFYPIEMAMRDVLVKITKGQSLFQSLKENNIFPMRMVYLVKAGEDVNKLDYFLLQLKEQYSNEIDYQSKLLGNIIEPLIILFLGAIIGLILISMYLPLFTLSSSI